MRPSPPSFPGTAHIGPSWLAALALLLLLCGPGVAFQDDAAPALDVVTIQGRPGFLDAYRKIVEGEERQGIDEMLQVLEAHGSDPDVYILHYNVACGYARMGWPETALVWLDRAVRAGYGVQAKQVQNLTLDPDLETLRTRPAFAPIFERAAQRSRHLQEDWDQVREPFVYVPSAAEGKGPLPLLIVLHPFGSQAEDFARAHFVDFAETHGILLMASTGSRMIAPRRWAWAVSSAEFVGRFRQDTRKILLDYQAVKGRHRIDEGRIYVTGFGQGASLAFVLGVRNPQWVRGVVAFSGGYSPAAMKDWVESAARFQRPLELFHGTADPVFPFEPLVAFAETLRGQGLNLTLRPWDGGHALPEDAGARLGAAIARFEEASKR